MTSDVTPMAIGLLEAAFGVRLGDSRRRGFIVEGNHHSGKSV